MKSRVTNFPTPPKAPESADPRAEALSSIFRLLVDKLGPEDREALLREIAKVIDPIPAPRAGAVLGAVIKFIHGKKGEFSAEEVKEHVAKSGTNGSPKEAYNALGYLTRRRHLRRVGYGRYLVVRMPPAMAAGIATSPMTMADIVALVDAAEGPAKKRGPYRPRISE